MPIEVKCMINNLNAYINKCYFNNLLSYSSSQLDNVANSSLNGLETELKPYSVLITDMIMSFK